MTDIIKSKLERGEYISLEESIEGMDKVKLRDVMMDIAYETESINVYGFLSYMARKHKNEEWLKLAVDIMLNPLLQKIYFLPWP